MCCRVIKIQPYFSIGIGVIMEALIFAFYREKDIFYEMLDLCQVKFITDHDLRIKMTCRAHKSHPASYCLERSHHEDRMVITIPGKKFYRLACLCEIFFANRIVYIIPVTVYFFEDSEALYNVAVSF